MKRRQKRELIKKRRALQKERKKLNNTTEKKNDKTNNSAIKTPPPTPLDKKISKEYKNNHYVPVWYQKRFVQNQKTDHELHYLNLNPPQYKDSKGNAHIGNAVRKLGFRHCFSEEDLYTTNINGIESSELEKIFFGQIDNNGRMGVEWCANFSYPWDGSSHINELMLYMSTQKLRTPKGLLWLRDQASKLGKPDKNSILVLLTNLRQLYGAIWMECVWLIADANKSDTKFIISDHPVTIYNRRYGPRSQWCRGCNDPDIRFHASHTLFPLSLDKILILTNLSWVRNPYQKEIEMRPNPKFFRSAIMKITDIQILRHLSEDEVRQINFIIKSRALNYIAAAKKDWLYPERYVSKSDWRNFGQGYLLMPDPRAVTYGGQILIGHNDGTSSAYDEYGRRPGQKGFEGFDKKGVDDDWYTLHQFQGEFARLFGPYRRGRACSNSISIDKEKDDDEFHQYHLDQEKKCKEILKKRK
jgi:hypothetical protein